MLSSLIEKLKKVKDFRSEQGKRYTLPLVLTLIVIAIMLGSVNYQEILNFLKHNSENLVKRFNIIDKKLPSYSTIRRVIMGVDWSELLKVFQEWAKDIYPKKNELDWLAIDGKSLRSTLKNSQNQDQNFVIIVSLFSQATGLVIDLKRIESKTASEITAAQDLVKDYDETEKIFTLDALHCNQKLTHQIIEKNNDYLIAVKKNNIKLYNQLETTTKKQKPFSQKKEYEKKSGREILRRVSVFKNLQIQHKSCQDLKSIIKVERVGFRGAEFYQKTAYYVSSILESAQIIAEKIKGHWAIENKLHWVKDVIFQEDKMKITDFQAATNFSILTTIAMNYFRILGFLSIKEGQRWLGNKWEKLLI